MRKLLILLFTFFLLFNGLVYGDSPNPNNISYLTINGAKIVSEGAFFWFEVKNNNNNWVEVLLSYPIEFRICLFNQSRPLHGMGVVVTNTTYSYPLDPSELFCVGFVAPFLNENDSFQSYLFNFKSGVGGISTEKAIDHTQYSVLVVKSVINLMQITPSKLNDLLSKYAKLTDVYETLKQEYVNLLNGQYLLLESLVSIRFAIRVVIILVVLLAIFVLCLCSKKRSVMRNFCKPKKRKEVKKFGTERFA